MSPSEPPADNPCRPRHFKPASCTPAPLEGPAKQSLDTSHTRLLITATLFCMAFAIIAVRLVEVAGFKSGDQRVAHRTVATQPMQSRADIVDRNGVLLATTLTTPSLFADPKLLADAHIDAHDAARQLVRVLPDLDTNEVFAKLTSDKSFIWLKRQLTPRQEYEVNRLGIPGLHFQDEEKRVYPKGNLAAHVVGFVGLDNKGFAGVERGMERVLHGRTEPVELSLDVRLQFILRDEIAHQIADFTAIGGTGIIMDVRTGEILAMTSLPDFDPNDPGSATPEELFDRATLGTYEMGSVFKIFNTAIALETHATTMDSGYDATNPIRIDRFTIHDDHPQRRWLTVPEIFMYSSNIGSAKMALDIGADRQRDYLGRLGLLRAPTDFQLRELGEPLVPNPWRPINTMTIGFGQGMSVTELQLATAAAAVVNGGILHHATLLKHPPGYAAPGDQVLSEATSEDMRKLLRLVVEHGTGKNAEAPGFVVGGKTGTAEKVTGRRYAIHSLLSSFLGVFPVNDPRFLVLVSIDEPHGNAKSFGFATGGWVAAPAVKHIVERMASIEGIQPVDEDSPEIRRSLMVNLPVPPGRKFAAN
jgi:cell division protein FtsI (penicillin-binding protein 3)